VQVRAGRSVEQVQQAAAVGRRQLEAGELEALDKGLEGQGDM